MLSSSFLFSAKGRITRLQYWRSFPLFFGLFIALFIGLLAMGIGGASYTQYMSRANPDEQSTVFEDSPAAVADETGSTHGTAPDADATSSDPAVATMPDDADTATGESAPMDEGAAVEGEVAAFDADAEAESSETPAIPDETEAVVVESSGVVGGLVGFLIGMSLIVALVYSAAVIQIKRWHDQNLSGSMVLINFTGVGSLVTFIMCGFPRGTAGPNPYGADPLATA